MKKSFNFTKMSSPVVLLPLADKTTGLHAHDSQSSNAHT
jgi:hypothetical protein